MTLATLSACVGVLGALQALYLFVKNMEAAKQADGPSMWTSAGDASFDGSDDQERETERRMKKNFEIARAKAIMAMDSQFADKAKA